MRTTILLGCALLVATGCAGAASQRKAGKQVDPELTAQLPNEGRRWTYEAENEVIIALDRLDARKAALASRHQDLEAGERALAAAEKRGKGQEPVKARIAWLEQRVDHAEAEVEVAELGVLCARTNLELTRAKAAVRFGLPVEEDFVKPFEEEYQDCAKSQEAAAKEASEEAAATVKAKEGWRKARGEFASKTGDHDHGLWID